MVDNLTLQIFCQNVYQIMLGLHSGQFGKSIIDLHPNALGTTENP